MNLPPPPNAPDTSSVRLGDRSLFPKLEAQVYLSHAAISPTSILVEGALAAVADDYARRGVAAFMTWRAQRERLRGVLGRMIGAAPQDIAYVASTTASVVAVARCFPWKAGDRILCFKGEFPTNVTPWQQAARSYGAEVIFHDAEDFRTERGLERLRTELKKGIRLVAISAVEFQSGLRMPLKAIADLAHEAGAQVFVDAIQACGAVPIDVGEGDIDYLGCGSHKWLMGMEGAGFLYVRPDRASELIPRLAGWLSHEEPLAFLFEGAGHLRYNRPIRKGIDFLEGGAINAAGFAGLEASVASIEALGVATIYQHIQTYLDALEGPLIERGFASGRHSDPALRSATLSMRAPADKDLAGLNEALGERGVICTTPDGWLRFAPHFPNALAEVETVIGTIDEALGALG